MSIEAQNPVRTRAVDEFRRLFGGPPTALVRSPGRVNLIGEHTDYNSGFVLPLAIESATWIALRPRDDGRVRLHSGEFGQTTEFALNDITRGGPDWAEYAKGVAEQLLLQKFTLRGFDASIASDVPVGAGLSSSASFSLGITRAFHATSGFAWDRLAMAQLCQRVEQQRIGVNCGIMDQLVISAAHDGQALLIDCRSFATRTAPLPRDHVVVILDTKKSRTLAGSAYNQRRAECETAAKFFGVPALRDVTLDQLTAAQSQLDPVVGRRARHVISENNRVEQALSALQSGDAARLGELMNASHESLRADYEVSCAELDEICVLARAQAGCAGARMTGAGFGGCAVALVAADKAGAFIPAVTAGFEKRFGVKPALYPTRATAGVTDVTL
jgi:galactokinase